SAPMENITVSLDTYVLWPYFEKVVSGEKMPSKPDPAIFLETARKMETTPDKCLVIEDSKPGMLGAHRAGMQVICKLGTVKQAPEYALAAFEDYPQKPADHLANLLV
ncbi:MAG TPA: HAD-IA family hydrolase, partial [Anaerolineaceae bacterium]|nr:HAD-IA family hydrolase [Anaerolineaceae bacterium]